MSWGDVFHEGSKSSYNGWHSECWTTHALCTGGTPSTSRAFSNKLEAYETEKIDTLRYHGCWSLLVILDFWCWTLL